MEGYKLFVDKMNKLSVEERNKIIKRIFGFKKVILYSLDEEDGDVVFRIYNGIRYYRIKFIFEIKDKNGFLEIRDTSISLYCDIFIKKYVDDGSCLSNFVKILLEGDISYFDSFL